MEYISASEGAKLAKKALKEQGYDVVRARKGKGTASNWIEIVVILPDDIPYLKQYPASAGHTLERISESASDYRQSAEKIAAEAAGRSDLKDDIQSDYFERNMLVQAVSREMWVKKYA